MGIRTGKKQLLHYLCPGIHYSNAAVGGLYKISVDGELMRYKGMYTANLNRDNAEEIIAETSVVYLKRLLQMIIQDKMKGVSPVSIDVYMDGTRVRNKELRTYNATIDHNKVRYVFELQCRSAGLNVIRLEMGEAELAMYLKRDQNMILNIFVTYDSDILSILYGHEPLVVNRRTGMLCSGGDVDSYSGGEYDVRDSCLLAYPCKDSDIRYCGFDFSAKCFEVRVWRTMMALCGTDFTSAMLSEKMLEAILTGLDADDREFLNGLEEYSEIAATLLFYAVRRCGLVKRRLPSPPPPPPPSPLQTPPPAAAASTCSATAEHDFSVAQFNKNCQLYCDYVATGNMNGPIVKISMSQASRFFLWAMQNICKKCYIRPPSPHSQKKILMGWASRVDVKSAIGHFRNFETHRCLKKKLPHRFNRLEKYYVTRPQQLKYLDDDDDDDDACNVDA